jgi:hypothetical protein
MAETATGRDPGLRWPAFLLAAGVGLALALAALDPAPSRGLAPGLRVAFWLLHCLIPLALLEACQMALGRWPALDRRSPWLSATLAGLIGAALFAPVALALDAVFPLPVSAADDGTLAAELLDEFRAFAPPMVLIWLGLNATRFAAAGRELSLSAAGPPAAGLGGSPSDALWEKVPPRLGRDLVALSAELHYLRVVTKAGDALILFSFGRALPLVAGIPGLRIHRSHWVALAHVEEVRRSGERVSVRLVTGLELPVSRAARPALRAARVGR